MRQKKHQPDNTCYSEHERHGDGNFGDERAGPIAFAPNASKDGQGESEGSQKEGQRAVDEPVGGKGPQRRGENWLLASCSVTTVSEKVRDVTVIRDPEIACRTDLAASGPPLRKNRELSGQPAVG